MFTRTTSQPTDIIARPLYRPDGSEVWDGTLYARTKLGKVLSEISIIGRNVAICMADSTLPHLLTLAIALFSARIPAKYPRFPFLPSFLRGGDPVHEGVAGALQGNRTAPA